MTLWAKLLDDAERESRISFRIGMAAGFCAGVGFAAILLSFLR